MPCALRKIWDFKRRSYYFIEYLVKIGKNIEKGLDSE